MQYLIDGHNLIPKLGLSLRSADDEMQLVVRLQAFCRVKRSKAEVYFDGAPAGQVGTRSFGLVTAHFVRKASTADSAIRARLDVLARAARNWIVVSSDHEVQSAARTARAQVLSSDEFAELVRNAGEALTTTSAEHALSAAEVDEWLKVFRAK